MDEEKDDVGVSIHAGFPNPASDRTIDGIDLHKFLIKHPVSTFFMRIEGNQWEERGIFNNDIAVIDRAVNPRKTDLVIITKDDEFLLIGAAHIPTNSTYWGTVTNIIHQLRS